jgi:hypothetical protein
MGAGSSHNFNFTAPANMPNQGTDPDQTISSNGVATYVSYFTLSCPSGSTISTCPVDNTKINLSTPNVPGTPANLSALITQVGANNITYDCYVNIQGTITGHDCDDIWAITVAGGYGSGVSDQTNALAITQNALAQVAGTKGTGNGTTPITIAQSSGNPNVNAPINMCDPTQTYNAGNVNVGGLCWAKFYTGTLPLAYIQLNASCSGSGCGCQNQGASNISAVFRYEIHVNFMSYCSQSTNLGNNYCFNLLGAYLGKYPSNQITDAAMANYCSNKYPSGTMSMFNTQNQPNATDYQLCPCNMPTATYNDFVQAINTQFPTANLTQLHPPCLVPACKASTYKNSSLQGCPGPQCINLVNFQNNSVQGNVNFNQSADCTSLGFTPGATGQTNSPTPTSSTPSSTSPSTTSSFFSTYKVYIIIGIIILIILIIILVFWFSSGGEETAEANGTADTELSATSPETLT